MRRLVCCLTLLLLAGCIDVDDFGVYWARGTQDEALIGSWVISDAKKSKDNSRIIVKSADGSMQLTFFEEGDVQGEANIARTLKIGDSVFLMIKKVETPIKAGGMILRYALLENGELAFYSPEKAVKNDFLKSYKGDGLKVGTYDTLKIGTLTESAINDIRNMAGTPGAFVEVARYTKRY